MNWENRDNLSIEYGFSKPLDLVYGACLRLPGTVRRVAKSARNVTGFEVGVLLGQSSGWCQAFFDGRGAAETCWCYRDRAGLLPKLAELGVTLESLTGLLDTETPKKLLKFMSRLAPDSEKMKRYPLRRWGWAFIEDELAQLAVERAFGSQAKDDGKQADGEKENETDDDLLAKYLDPLTPLQTKVVDVLWIRRHRTKFDTLRSTAWKDRRPVSDRGIVRLLKRINARWARLVFSLEISEPKKSVKLIRPDPKADGKV